VLVVDDEESIRKVMIKILEDEGYIVDTAGNGAEAVTKTKSEFFNLALIDIRLPDMDGTQLLSAIKDTTPKMVKIIVTGYPSLQNAVAAVNQGADAYIIKPFDVEVVLRTIRDHLQKQREARTYSEGKIIEFIKTRARELGTTTPP